MRGWELLENFTLLILDKRGVEDLAAVEDAAIAYINHLKTARDGVHVVYSHGFFTFMVHCMVHVAQYIKWHGNLWEYWCFGFERTAGIFVGMLSKWNRQGYLSEYLSRALNMKEATYLSHQLQMDEELQHNEGHVNEGQDWGSIENLEGSVSVQASRGRRSLQVNMHYIYIYIYMCVCVCIYIYDLLQGSFWHICAKKDPYIMT